MPLPRFLFGVCVIACFVLPLSANETPTLERQRQEMLDHWDDVFVFDLLRNPNPDMNKLAETLQQLRDAESLFLEVDEENPEAEKENEQRAMYHSRMTGFFISMAIKTEDATKRNALFDECEGIVMMHEEDDEQYREYALAELRRLRQYGRLVEEAQTVEDALKIEYIPLREEALCKIAQQLSRQAPPNFTEALRAVKKMEEDRLNGELCLSLIAVRQARAGLFDDAEATYRLIGGNDFSNFKKLETLFTFVLIHEQREDIESAKRWIEEAFQLGYAQKDAQWFQTYFFQYCHSCITQLKNDELVRYIYDKMLALRKEGESEIERILAEFREGKLTQHGIGAQYRRTDALTFAQVAARLGDRETAKRHFDEAKMFLQDWDINLHEVIAAMFAAGFHAEARKELDDYIFIPMRENRFTRYVAVFNLLSCLNESADFTEIVTIVKAIPDEAERFKQYSSIVFLVRQRVLLSERDECIQRHPLKRFSSPQEILDIAEMLTDEPDGKSLESYRKKLRRLADRR